MILKLVCALSELVIEHPKVLLPEERSFNNIFYAYNNFLNF